MRSDYDCPQCGIAQSRQMKTAWRLYALVWAVFLAACLSSCAKSDGTRVAADGKALGPSPEKERPTVAVSILPEKAFVEAVGQDLVNVVCMIVPGASPETYEATPLAMANLEKAALYFSIGVPAEKAILENLSSSTRLVKLDQAIDEAIPPLRIGNERDPHVWLSPARAVLAVGKIADELGALDPDNSGLYQSNAAAYIEKIQRTREDVAKMLEDAKGACFIVYHPAFGYFADEFGLETTALEESGKEASPRRMAQVADFAKARGIKTVFYQGESDSRRAEAFAEGIGGKAEKLEPLAYDYTENLKAIAEAIREAAR